MATGRNSDLVPLRKNTKQRLADLKGDASYDEAIRALLDVVPAAVVRARLRSRPATAPPAAVASSWREPEKQQLVADLAEQSWNAWRRAGRIRDIGPRMVAWSPPPKSTGGALRVVARPGRGLPP